MTLALHIDETRQQFKSSNIAVGQVDALKGVWIDLKDIKKMDQ